MDYIELRKRKLFKKYHESDIFNIKTEPNMNKTYRPSLHKTVQPSLDKTKSYIFNKKEKNGDLKKSKTVTKRKLHLKNYKSDIFNTNVNDINRKKSCKRINVNYSTCFDGIKNGVLLEMGLQLKDFIIIIVRNFSVIDNRSI